MPLSSGIIISNSPLILPDPTSIRVSGLCSFGSRPEGETITAPLAVQYNITLGQLAGIYVHYYKTNV